LYIVTHNYLGEKKEKKEYFNKHSTLVSYNIYGMRTIIITDD